MADFTALKTAIQDAIKQNGNNEITGEILQGILLSMVNTLGDGAINDLVAALAAEVTNRQNAVSTEATTRGNADTTLGGRIDGVITSINSINTKLAEGYIYGGIATPSMSMTTPAGKVFYFAVQAGTYTNFGNTVLTQGLNILKYNGTAWSGEQLVAIDNTPTENSTALVKSGGVFSAIKTVADKLAEGYLYKGIATASTDPDTPSTKVFYIATTAGTYTNFGSLVVTQGINILKYNGTSWITEQVYGVDDEPTAASKNLITSGAVCQLENDIKGFNIEPSVDDTIIQTTLKGDIKVIVTNVSAVGEYCQFGYEHNGSWAGDIQHNNLADITVKHGKSKTIYLNAPSVAYEGYKIYLGVGFRFSVIVEGTLRAEYDADRMEINKNNILSAFGIAKYNLYNKIVRAFDYEGAPFYKDQLNENKALLYLEQKKTNFAATDFVLTTGVSISGDSLIYNNVSNWTGAVLQNAFVAGKKYKITLSVRNFSKGNCIITDGSEQNQSAYIYTNGEYSYTMEAIGVNLLIVGIGTASSFEVKDVSITELPQFELCDTNDIIDKTPNTTDSVNITVIDDGAIYTNATNFESLYKTGACQAGHSYYATIVVSEISEGSIAITNGNIIFGTFDKAGVYGVKFTAEAANFLVISLGTRTNATIRGLRLYEIANVDWNKNEDELLYKQSDTIFVGSYDSIPSKINKCVITEAGLLYDDKYYLSKIVNGNFSYYGDLDQFGILNNDIEL